MRMKYFVVSLLISLVLSQNALAEPGKYLDKMLEVRRDIQLLNLINGLELDREQIKFIVQRAADAEKIREEFRRQFEKGEAETIQVFKEFRERLREGEKISPLLKRQVRRANSSRKHLKEEMKRDYEKRMAALALNIQERLYEYQLHILDQYRPCLIPPAGGNSAGQVENSKGVERQLTRIRNMPASAFERRKEELVQRIRERIRQRLPRGFIIEEEEEKKRILSIFNEARNLADVDFALKKTELVQKFQSKHALPQRSISLSTKIERFLLTPEIVPLLKEKLNN